MTKSELVAVMAQKASISKVAAGKALDVLIRSIQTTVGKGGKVTLVGFGTFSATKRAARKGRNPQTGAIINIPAAKVPKFKAGADFKKCCR